MPHVLAQDLRNAVLQAAMQGKLTEQLESDGDVYEYFDSITQKRKELIKEKQLKKESCLDSPIDETPFDIPDSWKWCYLGECIQLTSGADLTPDRYNDKGQGTVYITGASNIENGKVIVNRWTDSPRSIAKKGDLLLTCKGTVGTTCFLDLDEAHIARQIMSIRPIDVHPRYINAFISYYVNQLKAMAKSMIPGIERKNVLTALFPLPPVEEQARIVARVDELMAKIDEYEKIEKELTELQKAFPGNMKDAILQAAMQGKLTEQLKSDGDVRTYLKSNGIEFNGLEEEPFDIPESWEWHKFGEFGILKNGYAFKSSEYVKDGIQVVRISDLGDDKILSNNNVYYSERKELEKYEIVSNSFLICLTGSIGKMARVNDNVKRYLNQRVGMFIPSETVDANYLWLFLHSNYVIEQWNKAKTSTNGNIKNSNITNLLVPIPPKKEQQRIVDKLDQLLPLCEQLEKMAA